MADTPSTTSASDEIIHESRITVVQGLVLLLCMFIGIIDATEIVLVSYTAPGITRDLAVSPGDMGLLLSASLAGMTLGAMFLSPLSDIYGRRLVISACLLVAGAATHAVHYTDSISQLIVLRVVAGLAIGPLLASIPTLMGELSPRRHRTLILAIYYSLSGVGSLLCGIVAAEVMPTHGWKPIFFYVGILSILSGIAFLALVPESLSYISRRDPKNALQRINRILTYLRHPTIESLPPMSGHGSQESASVVSLLVPRRRTVTLMAWSTFFLSFATVYFLSSWIPQALVNFGYSEEDAIYGSVYNTAGNMIGILLLGWLAKRFRLNILISLVFAVGAALMVVLGIMLIGIGDIAILSVWIVLFLIGLTANAGFPNLYTVVLAIYPAHIRTTGLGWCIGLGRGGAVISPALAGLMIGIGATTPVLFVVFGLPILLSAGFIRLINMKEMA